ncbi:hypothetical protein D3C75_773950 [compost metagenome]
MTAGIVQRFLGLASRFKESLALQPRRLKLLLCSGCLLAGILQLVDGEDRLLQLLAPPGRNGKSRKSRLQLLLQDQRFTVPLLLPGQLLRCLPLQLLQAAGMPGSLRHAPPDAAQLFMEGHCLPGVGHSFPQGAFLIRQPFLGGGIFLTDGGTPLRLPGMLLLRFRQYANRLIPLLGGLLPFLQKMGNPPGLHRQAEPGFFGIHAAPVKGYALTFLLQPAPLLQELPQSPFVQRLPLHRLESGSGYHCRGFRLRKALRRLL